MKISQRVNIKNNSIKITTFILLYFLLYISSVQCSANKNHTLNQNSGHTIGQSFVFGVMADIQYADKDSLRGRHFRTTLTKLEECISYLNTKELAFSIQLGDIIDGYKENKIKSQKDLDSIFGIFNRLTMPIYHVIGNHDMTVGKEYLQSLLKIKQFYYDFTIPSAKGWHFVILDGNDKGYGIMGDEQINWFRTVLNKANEKGERVICFSHYALIQSAASNYYMAEPEPIIEILDSISCVVAWIAGHDHKGGYALRNGVHHITIKGMVEAPVKNAYAIIELYPDKIKIRGIGKEEDRELALKTISIFDKNTY